jgi:hypothetical protein
MTQQQFVQIEVRKLKLYRGATRTRPFRQAAKSCRSTNGRIPPCL